MVTHTGDLENRCAKKKGGCQERQHQRQFPASLLKEQTVVQEVLALGEPVTQSETETPLEHQTPT